MNFNILVLQGTAADVCENTCKAFDFDDDGDLAANGSCEDEWSLSGCPLQLPPPSTPLSSDKGEHALAPMARTRQVGLRLGTTLGSVCASGFGPASDGEIAPSGTISIGKIRRA